MKWVLILWLVLFVTWHVKLDLWSVRSNFTFNISRMFGEEKQQIRTIRLGINVLRRCIVHEINGFPAELLKRFTFYCGVTFSRASSLSQNAPWIRSWPVWVVICGVVRGNSRKRNMPYANQIREKWLLLKIELKILNGKSYDFLQPWQILDTGEGKMRGRHTNIYKVLQ